MYGKLEEGEKRSCYNGCICICVCVYVCVRRPITQHNFVKCRQIVTKLHMVIDDLYILHQYHRYSTNMKNKHIIGHNF